MAGDENLGVIIGDPVAAEDACEIPIDLLRGMIEALMVFAFTNMEISEPLRIFRCTFDRNTVKSVILAAKRNVFIGNGICNHVIIVVDGQGFVTTVDIVVGIGMKSHAALSENLIDVFFIIRSIRKIHGKLRHLGVDLRCIREEIAVIIDEAGSG